jgi:hypothetical protein
MVKLRDGIQNHNIGSILNNLALLQFKMEGSYNNDKQ